LLFPKVSGYIRYVEKQYERFKNIFITNYTMNIITPNVADTPKTQMDPGHNFAYAPTAASQRNYGYGWLSGGTINKLAANSRSIKNLPRNN